MNYLPQYAGAVYVGTGEIYGKNDFGGFGSVSIDNYTTNRQVTLTGEVEYSAKGNAMYRTTSTNSGGQPCYVMITDEPWELSHFQKGNANAVADYIKKIIKNNRTIFLNNLVCAKFANRLSSDQQRTLYNLQERLANRDEVLRDGNFVSQNGLQEARAPEGYRELTPYLEAFMSRGRVGAILSTPTIIVSAVALASVATASYFLWKSFYDESERDVRFSEGLMNTLRSKLTEAEYEELLRETRGIVTKAKIKASFSALGGLGKWLLIGVGGYAVYQFAKKNYKKKK